MLKHLVPTLSTFTYLRFEFLADDYLTPEERLRKSMQLASYQMLANNPKRAERVTHATSGTHLHEMITADFAALEHRELITHLHMSRGTPSSCDMVICEDKRPPRSIRQILDSIEFTHLLPILPKATRGQP